MDKIIIIGCPGSGKTTFSKALAKKTSLELIHLDNLCYRENFERPNQNEFDIKLSTVLKKPQWIIDGNFNRTIKARLEKCDTVFYFDLPFYVCLFGAIKRTIDNYGKIRDDVGGNCVEKFDREKISFFNFIIAFNHKHRKNYYKMLGEYKDKNIIIFKSRKEADEYLKNFQAYSGK